MDDSRYEIQTEGEDIFSTIQKELFSITDM